MKILVSAVGDTDPIRNFHDGALVHIARKYRPDKIFIIFSERTIGKKENIEKYFMLSILNMFQRSLFINQLF